MSSSSLSLSVKSETGSVTFVVQELEKFCKEHHISSDLMENLLIATDEAITNIVMHAYGGRTDGEIIVKFNINDEKIIIEMNDFGKKFQPTNIKSDKPKFKLDELEVGGYGLFLINEFMDELRFIWDKDKKSNRLVMKKYFFFD